MSDIRGGDAVQRIYGDKYLRAEHGVVVYLDHGRKGEPRARIRWFCAGGATTHSTVALARLRRVEEGV